MTEVTKIEAGTAVGLARETDTMFALIERMATDPNANLDKIERMLAMKEKIDDRNASIAFSAAIAAARAEIPPIVKDATVDFTSQKGRTHYKHETLAGIARAIDPVLSKFGLSYRFRTDDSQRDRVRVTCIISHAGGHSEENSLSGPPDSSGSKNPFQAAGSAVTYLQRYTLKAALGLSAEVDDDGQSAAPRPGQRQQEDNRQQSQQRGEPPDDFERDVKAAIRDIERERDMQSLAALFGDMQRRAYRIAADKRVIAAKDAAKARITAASKPLTGEIVDDEIPY